MARWGAALLLAIPIAFLAAIPVAPAVGNPQVGAWAMILAVLIGGPLVAVALSRGARTIREALRRGFLILGVEGALAPIVFFVVAIVTGIRTAADPAPVGGAAIIAAVIGIVVAVAIGGPSFLLHRALKPSEPDR